MSNLEKANKETLAVMSDIEGYFVNIKAVIENGLPKLLHSGFCEQMEYFIYQVEGEKKFFIETRVSEKDEYTTTRPRFELSSRYDDVVDSYLNKYPPYLLPNETLELFIENDLPKLADHEWDKRVFVICWTYFGQGNVGHFKLDHKFLELLAKSGLFINYAVEVQK